MKKIFGIMLSVALLASCSGNKESKEVTPGNVEVIAEEVVSEDVALPDESNAQNALDYEGTYKGILPTASGSGMNVIITLDGNNYTKEVSYIGDKKDKPTTTLGTYKWNETGTIITLEGDPKPNQYFVGENTLTQLDIDGNKITGDIASQYILKK